MKIRGLKDLRFSLTTCPRARDNLYRAARDEMSSLISGGERERVNIRRGLGAGGDTTGSPAAENGYGWGVEAPKSSAPPAKASASGHRSTTTTTTYSSSSVVASSSGGGGGGGQGARASAAVPTDDPLMVKRLTSQVRQPSLPLSTCCVRVRDIERETRTARPRCIRQVFADEVT